MLSIIQNRKRVNDAIHQHSFQAFSQSCTQTSDVTCSGKTAEMHKLLTLTLTEFLINQNIIDQKIPLIINRLIKRYFSQSKKVRPTTGTGFYNKSQYHYHSWIPKKHKNNKFLKQYIINRINNRYF